MDQIFDDELRLAMKRLATALMFMLCLASIAGAPLMPESASASEHGATRSLSSSWVSPGDELVVFINATGYGGFGQVVESIPTGFAYIESSLEVGAREEGRELFFTLLGDVSFTYTVTASEDEGTYSFAGVLKDSNKEERAVRGDSQVIVSSGPPPTPEPTPPPTPTTSATPSPTPTPELMAAPEPTSEPTAVSTMTPTPETTATHTPVTTPEATPTPTAVATVASTPTSTSERTPSPTVEPTAVREADTSASPASEAAPSWLIPGLIAVSIVVLGLAAFYWIRLRK